ncbi:MAG: hypothetical protein ACJAS1_007484 [Oleiphilaceae bacterium]|jgi:hypothetical protein
MMNTLVRLLLRLMHIHNGIQKTNDGEYVANAIANILGEKDEDRPYCGHEIDANIQLVYKPVIGRNGYKNQKFN